MKTAVKPRRQFKLGSDGYPILDHEMAIIYIEIEEKCRLTKRMIKRLAGLLQKKDIAGVRQILNASATNELLPWEKDVDAWRNTNEEQGGELIRKYIVEPHYKLYRNEMVAVARVRLDVLSKLTELLAELIDSLNSKDKKKLQKILQKLQTSIHTMNRYTNVERMDGNYSCKHGNLHPGSCNTCAHDQILKDPWNSARELAALRHLWERLTCYFSGDVFDGRFTGPSGNGISIGADGMKGISHVQTIYDELDS